MCAHVSLSELIIFVDIIHSIALHLCLNKDEQILYSMYRLLPAPLSSTINVCKYPVSELKKLYDHIVTVGLIAHCSKYTGGFYQSILTGPYG